MCSPSQATAGVTVVEVRASRRSLNETLTFVKSLRRVTRRKIAEFVPFDEVAFGSTVSGIPDQAAPARANNDPEVISQVGLETDPGAPGFQ